MWDARRPTSSSESPMTGSNTGTLSPPRSPGSKEDHRVPRNTASARVIFTSSASRPLGGNSRILRWTSHRRRGSTSCDSRAAATVIRQPRFIPIQAATMPSRSLTTEAAALASERETTGSGPDFPEHEGAVPAHLDMDFDIGVGQIHAHSWMGEPHDVAELAGQVLARERMGTHAPRPKRERLPGREGPLRLGEDDVPQ